MLDEIPNPRRRAPLSAAQRATPASIDLIALCHSLPADGHLRKEDLEVLKDWTARYHDIPLPSQEYVSRVVEKALEKRVVDADDRQSVCAALEPALPLQLRKETQERRLLAELAASEQEGGRVATVSLDFLVAGVHVDGRWRTIRSQVNVGDPVQLVRRVRSADGATMSVVLANGQCIGVVPDEEGRTIAQELDRGGRVEAVVKKILNDGQFPVPVIGSRIHCIASDVSKPISVFMPAPKTRRAADPTVILSFTLAGGVLVGGLLVAYVLLAR